MQGAPRRPFSLPILCRIPDAVFRIRPYCLRHGFIMKTTLTLTGSFAVLALSAGCANLNQFYEGLYEGLKFRHQHTSLPQEKSLTEPPLSYPQYEAERKALQKKVGSP